MQRGVFITFDVECSMGGAWADPSFKPVPPSRAIWGEYGDKKLGLPLIVGILNRHGLNGTFFLEPFMDEQGHPGQGEPICQYLLDHGQDVQLHIHPNHKHYGQYRRGEPHNRTDQMADLSPSDQLALIQEGAERVQKWTGRRPTAFRAGNMGASEETLTQLEAADILIDSSYTFCYAGGQCRFNSEEPYNGSKQYGRVTELALSGFRQRRYPGLHPAKPMDLVGISFPECRQAIKLVCGAGADAVTILHSFSLFKWRDVQYHGGRPNRIVTRRLEQFCRWLAACELPAYTFSELAQAIADGTYQARHVPPCRLTHPRAVVRKAVQAWNNFYWT